MKTRKKKKKSKPVNFNILFVCSGNSCRSPMAKGLMDKIITDNLSKNHKISAFSTGTIAPKGQLLQENAQNAVQKFGADISSHLSAPLTMERIRIADLILTMEEKHKIAVLELMPEAKNKTFIITEYVNKNKQGIADPIGQPFETYQETAKELYEILNKVYNKIIRKI
jgi:protein-tyrosine-phosphatase